ncbi:MAG: hypothetical protein FJ083_12540 [Cyanobacteria bacterium K_Offshore_surface_m2_239]|nr:hypothetical protein [Cyanobacteria bacterium K_Offshore_surface_m2_239]
MASPSPSDRDRVAVASGAVGEAGLIEMPTEMVQEDGSSVEGGVRPAMDTALPYRALHCVAKEAMPPPILEEINRHGWPVAPGEAYPAVLLRDSPLRLIPPCRDDLEPLEAAALALVAWIEAEPRIAALREQPSPKRRRFPVEVAGKRVSVTIGVVPTPSSATPANPPAKATAKATAKAPAKASITDSGRA